MDRYNPSPQYPYNNGYGYPPQNQPYPPPNQHYPPQNPHYPPPNQHYPPPPQQHPAYPYPYAPHPYPQPYGQPPPQYPDPAAGSYPQPGSQPYPSNPYPPPSAPYPHTLPPHDDGSQHGSPHFHHQDSGQYPPSSESVCYPPRDSFSGSQRYDSQVQRLDSKNGLDNKPSEHFAYPPVDDLMADLRLSDKPGSVPASPPAPSAPSIYPMHQPSPSSSGSFDYPGGYYGYSPSPGWDGSYSNRINPQAVPALTQSASFDGSRPNSNHGSQHFHSHSMQLPSPQHNNSQSLALVPHSPSKGSLKVLLLHGNLDIWIYDAKCLPNMDMFHRAIGDVISNFKIGGGKLDSVARKVTSDPYVSISIADAVIGRTYVLSNEENPDWKQHFNVPVAHHAAEVHFLVKDSDVVGSQLMGSVAIPVEQIYSGALVSGTYPILNNNGKPCKPGASLRLSIQYMPIETLSMYHNGVGAGPDYQGVPGTFFPLRKGGSVTLYQDAHVPEGHLPSPWLDSGLQYAHGKCWEDICNAIKQARRLVYITGWSVWHSVRLVRDGSPASDYPLGELLRSKSQEGVRVLLLVWDDPTSRSILGYKTDGLMATHDEETRSFFKHSSVQVLLCPRIAGKRHSWIRQREVEAIYTHHQKTVIVDADAGNNARKIIAFVGGLDLCDGRYDTPGHSLFRTLNTVHKDDYHNPSFAGNTDGCPREPWHDLHSKIEGPAAYDVLTNFEDRWLKAAKPRGIKKLKTTYDDALLRIERVGDILGIADAPYLNEDNPEAWHVQIFRSIDSNSVKGFPNNPKEATAKNLVCGKNVLIDMSIHSAYVKAIRSAQRYIYIENQYFIGSSYNWNQHKNVGANNLIPMEIALKIVEKIKAHERFAVYIVIPMWPEGVPTSAPTQRILYWQNKTMQMMYEMIYKALVEVGLEDSYTPQDYLNFFCLGNRESYDPGHVMHTGHPHPPNTPQAQCLKSRRFMIYVHSKGMIVDDEYVILGSANINQRSMEGTRDTEIAMGAYQPNHTWARRLAHPHGQVFGYRMSLWAEHLGGLEETYNEPETLECVRRVRSQAEMNWQQFASDQVTEMRAHLLKYPVDVDRRGKVKPLQGCEQFPDLGGNICGSFLVIQENLTI